MTDIDSMKFIVVLIFITIFSGFTFAEDKTSKSSNFEEAYNSLLNDHLNYGHLNKGEIEVQRYQYSKQKKWQNTVKEQVRGISSSFKKNLKVLKLKNPAIEISTK